MKRITAMQIYLGTFLIAFATLALEITLTRLLSVATWYHLAFFAIATAMLGMTAGATLVYLRPSRFTVEKLNQNLATACLRFALVAPIALIVLCLVPPTLAGSAMGLATMIVASGACSLPFCFGGIALTLVLTKCRLPVGVVYASDLIGASFGCLFVLWGLEFLDAPSLTLLCAAIGALAAFVFGSGQIRTRRVAQCFAAFALMTVIAFANSATSRGIRPAFVKGKWHPAHWYKMERWNSYSRVTVGELTHSEPHYWGASVLAPRKAIPQYYMTIDGGAGTPVGRFHSLRDAEYLRYDVTNLVYYLRPKGKACVIGVGGGRDIQSALLFGHEHVTGIEINPIFIDLLKSDFREFANLTGRTDVDLVVDEARGYLSRTTEKFSTIQMSLIDTWAATGAGAFSLSENSLYTVEAWKVFLSRLQNGGIFTASRWYNPKDLGETGRLMSLAVAGALESGVRDPSQHIALITCDRICTLLLSKDPMRQPDIHTLKQVCAKLEYDSPVLPGHVPEHPTLRQIMAARSFVDLCRIDKHSPLRYDPPTDENPYFFNMLRLGKLGLSDLSEGGVMRGNLIATLTLIALVCSLLIVAAATILVPLALGRRFCEFEGGVGSVLWAGAAYFSLIGIGFMLVEIALIQKLSVLLSHPVYALGVLLFTMILSTGLGSLTSEKLPLHRAPWIFVYPGLGVGAILAVHMVVGLVLSSLITSSMWTRILVSVLVIFPVGLVLGLFFPTGMRLVRAVRPEQTPWYWALNGIFGVLASAVAVFFSVFFGISTNFYIAAVCYGSILLCVWRLYLEQRDTAAAGFTSTSYLLGRGARATRRVMRKRISHSTLEASFADSTDRELQVESGQYSSQVTRNERAPDGTNALDGQ